MTTATTTASGCGPMPTPCGGLAGAASPVVQQVDDSHACACGVSGCSGGGEAAARLDHPDNNVTAGLQATGQVLVKPHGCRCRTCPVCGPRYGYRVRRRLEAKAAEFRRPVMFTLTVKPSHFGDDPRRAYLAITDGRFIPRLMKALGVVRWVWVLEFQASGWPHWHLLIDKPGPILDLRKAWRLWGHQHDRWRIGGIDMGQERKSGQEAVGYITKYLVKYPDRGFPDWLLDLDRRVRWVQASRAIGAVVSDADRSEKDVEGRENAAEAAESLPREHASLRVRQASCGQQVDFLREYVNPQTGEVKYLFAGRLRRDLVERSGLLSMIETKGNRAVMADPGNMQVFLAEVVGVAMRQGGPMATLELDMVRRCRPAVDRAKDLRSKSASFDAGR